MSRPDWDEYMMAFARTAALRGTCDRKRVGAVIVVRHRVLSTGYNGSIAGMPHCDDVGHDMVGGHCKRTVHAEMNALAQAAKHGVSVEEGDCYVTASPCWDCFRVLVNAGVRNFIYEEPYRAEEDRARIAEVAERRGLGVQSLSERRSSTEPEQWEYECRFCRRRIIIPPLKEHPGACPGCSADWDQACRAL